MNEIEKRIADVLLNYYEETEDSYPYKDYRIYTDSNIFNNVISSQGEMTDVLFFVFTRNEESGSEYVELFISSPDDMCQDFTYLTSLTEDEQSHIFHLFSTQVYSEFGVEC